MTSKSFRNISAAFLGAFFSVWAAPAVTALGSEGKGAGKGRFLAELSDEELDNEDYDKGARQERVRALRALKVKAVASDEEAEDDDREKEEQGEGCEKKVGGKPIEEKDRLVLLKGSLQGKVLSQASDREERDRACLQLAALEEMARLRKEQEELTKKIGKCGDTGRRKKECVRLGSERGATSAVLEIVEQALAALGRGEKPKLVPESLSLAADRIQEKLVADCRQGVQKKRERAARLNHRANGTFASMIHPETKAVRELRNERCKQMLALLDEELARLDGMLKIINGRQNKIPNSMR